jgi:hypothetical protein
VFVSWTTGAEFLVPDTGAFTDGSVARLRGTIVGCDTTCYGLPVHLAVPDGVLTPCPPESLGCGVLSGPYGDLDACWLWSSPRYGSLLIESHEGHAAGDTVAMVGIAALHCPNVCLIGDGCVFFGTFHSCRDTVTVAHETTWGRIKSAFR